MGNSIKIQPLRPDYPLVDKEGLLTREGYDYLLRMFLRVGGSSVLLDLDDLVTLELTDSNNPAQVHKAINDLGALDIASQFSVPPQTVPDSLEFSAQSVTYSDPLIDTIFTPVTNWASPGAIGYSAPNYVAAIAGSNLLPGFYLGQDINTGWYRISSNKWGFTVGGVFTISLDNTGLSTPFPITSTLAVGTAPFVITSTTKVTNLNVDLLKGKDWATPDPLGATVPNTGKFTSVEVTTGGSSVISTGVGSVKMSSANAATNSVWIPVKYAGTVYYIPGWTTNSP